MEVIYDTTSVEKVLAVPYKGKYPPITGPSNSVSKYSKFPREMKINLHKMMCTKIFIADLSLIAKPENNLNV